MLVDIQGLSFAYESGTGARAIIDLPQWSIEAGESVFLQGASGAGKSTLLNLLAGILRPSSGSISILGQPLHAMSGRARDQWRARHLGIVFQQFNLIPYLDAVSNIKLAAYLAGNLGLNKLNVTKRAQTLLRSLGIDDALHFQAAARLSVGQQQRVAIARALINKPELLIADEPTSALDSDARDQFMTLLLEQVKAHQSTLVFVSHDKTLADAFSRVEYLAEINRAGGED